MRKLLLAFALLTGKAASAQIIAEQTYDSNIAGGKLTIGEVKFAGYFPLTLTTGQVRIYNANYSLYKQVDVTLPSGYKVENITYISDKLFNTNALVEVALNIYDPEHGDNALRIVDENGAVLLSKDLESYPTIYNTPNGTKMVLHNYRANKSTIYALGGTLTPLATIAATSASESMPYPNPTTADIKLPYTVPAGQIAELVVRDVTGQQVKSYRVDSSFSYLLFSTTGLAPGVYYSPSVWDKPGASQFNSPVKKTLLDGAFFTKYPAAIDEDPYRRASALKPQPRSGAHSSMLATSRAGGSKGHYR